MIKLAVSLFPLDKNGLYRVTIKYKGKEYMFGGQDRAETLNRAFKFILASYG